MNLNGMTVEVINKLVESPTYFATFLLNTLANINGGGGMIGQLKTELNTAMSPAMDIVIALGLALVTLFFIISVAELAASERMNIDTFVKHFAKLIIGVVAVTKAPDFRNALTNLGNYFASQMGTKVTGGGAFDKTMENLLELTVVEETFPHLGWVFLIFILVPLLLTFMLIEIAIFVLGVVASILIVFEVILRGVFLPLSLAMLADDGWRGAGSRGIKRYLAACLTAGVYPVIARLGIVMIRATANLNVNIAREGFFALPLKVLLTMGLYVAALIGVVMCMFKAGNYINEAIGC